MSYVTKQMFIPNFKITEGKLALIIYDLAAYEGKEVFLLSIYDKSEQATITDSAIDKLLKGLY